ncbi:MAG: SDR family NAD(P)-dependent oxidoreductase [Cryobacterium sp.]|nr:SDR family NAD(P)-dependent oxidoreductase [Oligoflexia bacterium]
MTPHVAAGSRTLKHRRVVITGATGSLGQSVLARFHEAGDSIIAIHSPKQKVPAAEGVEWFGLDLTVRKSVIDFFSKLEDVDAVIHCAGGFRFGNIDAMSAEDFKFLNEVNFESSYSVATGAIPAMRKRKTGVLLFVSSKATISPAAGMSAYAATKAAVNAMVTSLAEEVKADGVRVNAVLPSVIDTPANRKAMPHADPSKWVSPDDLADILYDLTLSKARSITGALIPVTGRV